MKEMVFGEITTNPPDGIDPAWWNREVLRELNRKSAEGLKSYERNGNEWSFHFQIVHGRDVYDVSAYQWEPLKTEIVYNKVSECYSKIGQSSDTAYGNWHFHWEDIPDDMDVEEWKRAVIGRLPIDLGDLHLVHIGNYNVSVFFDGWLYYLNVLFTNGRHITVRFIAKTCDSDAIDEFFA